MERNDVFKNLTVIFRDVLDNNEIELSESTTAEDIEEWDSLANVQLVEKIQNSFGIKFSAYEITSWIDMGEMVDCILDKVNK